MMGCAIFKVVGHPGNGLLRHQGFIPFPNHPCTLSASIAVSLYCRRFTFAFTDDLEMELDTQS
jgi:hypothetical protein